MTRLYLARHAETLWNSEHKMQGWEDSPLSPYGIRQAEALRERLADTRLDAIYASDIGRARHTAEIARGAHALPLHTCAELREMNMAGWDGMTVDEAKASAPVAFDRFWNEPEAYSPLEPEGETYAEVQARALEGIHAIVAAHPTAHVLVVTHTITIKVLLAHFTGRPLNALWELAYLKPASLSIVEINGQGNARVLRQGEADYLPAAP